MLTSPTICRTRISSSSRPTGSSLSFHALLERHSVYRYECEEPAVRQSESTPGSGLRDPVQEDHGRGAVRPCEAHVWRARRCADASGLAAAAQVRYRHRQSQGVDGRGRAGERHRHHDFVRPRLCRHQRAALRAGAGKPGANRHQVHHQQGAGRQLAHRAQQEGAAALYQRVLRLARLPGILLHLVLPRQKFDLQHHELPVEGDRRLHRRRRDGRSEWRQGDLRQGREGLRRSGLRRHAARAAIPAFTSTSRCRRMCPATPTGSTAGSTIARWSRGEAR